MAHYEDWLQQLEKELKGKPWTELQWHLGEGIVLDPFYHPDVYFPQRQALGKPAQGNQWEIGESVEVQELKATHSLILAALQGGVEAIELSIHQNLLAEDWAVLLENVQLEYISLQIQLNLPADQQRTTLQTLYSYCLAKGFPTELLKGSILGVDKLPLEPHSISWAAQHLPAFKTLVIDGTGEYRGHTESAQELASMLQKAESLFHALNERGMDAGILASKVLFKVALSTSYFVEIAKLRALHILWSNVLKAYGLQEFQVPIAAYFAPGSQDNNTNSNLIRAATQALSAIIGGVQYLYVLPANLGAGEAPTLFSRRMARNVQHLLRLESHLDKVQDPAAGSFYIEKLTEELAEKAWLRWQQTP
jgi:methylmalonyl-CoA mutase